MGNFFTIAKRLGAIFIVIVLILMMGLIFSSQPLDEITQTLTGNLSAGEFYGKDISLKDYAFYEEGCRSWITEKKLTNSGFFLEHCISTRMRQSYSLLYVGNRLGLENSEDAIKQSVWEQAKEEYTLQQSVSPDDSLSVNEIYRFSLSRFPLRLRLQQSTVRTSYEILNSPFPKVKEQAKWEKATKATTLQLRIVYYDDRSLTEMLKKNITVSENEVMKRFHKEAKNKTELQKRKLATSPDKNNLSLKNTKKKKEQNTFPTPAQKKGIQGRLLATKANKEFKRIQAKLNQISINIRLQKQKQNSSGNTPIIQKIAKITGLQILKLSNVSFHDLGGIKAGKDRIDLLQKKFISKITAPNPKKVKYTIGPIESGPYKVYAEVQAIRLPRVPLVARVHKRKEKKIKKKTYEKESDTALTNELITYITEEEASRGGFTLRHPKKQQGTPSRPPSRP